MKNLELTFNEIISDIKACTKMPFFRTAIIKALINDGNKATFANIIVEVEQKQLKTNNPLKDCKITKLVNYNILLNTNYAKMVNNQRKCEGLESDFTPKESWHTPLFDGYNGSIVTNKKGGDTNYLKFACKTSKTLKYVVDGIEATEPQIAIIKAFRPTVKANTSQGLEEPITIRTIKLDNIREIKAFGETILL